jgi:glycosyltransferase involved in cell wall biosynthesis
MTRLLCERGVDTRILTTNTDPRGRWDVPLGKLVEQRGAPVVYYNIWPVNRWAFSAPLARALLREAQRYDVVHIHWLFNFSSWMAAVAARRARVPYVFQPNGKSDPNLMRRNARIKDAYIGLFGNYILRHAAAISYASAAEKRIACRSAPGIAAEVIPIGLDWKEYERLPERGAFRSTFPQLHGKRILLFLSRLSRQKGLDLLVRAFREVAPQFPDVHLVLAGPDGEGYGASVREWVANAGLADRVLFAGRVPDGLKLAAYVDADLFVLPSYAENFGACRHGSHGVPLSGFDL